MRIGLIAPPWITVPPGTYGGTESVIDNLARQLQRLGHDVLLHTVAASTCPVPRSYFFDDPVVPMGQSIPEAAHLLAAYESLQHCDVIHDHTVLGPLVAAGAGITSPPIAHPCYYGIDMASRSHLIAADMEVEEIRRFVGADSLHYISLDGLTASTPVPADRLCRACFDGHDPIPVPGEQVEYAADGEQVKSVGVRGLRATSG